MPEFQNRGRQSQWRTDEAIPLYENAILVDWRSVKRL